MATDPYTMNSYERILIEKAGAENGWETVFIAKDNSVSLRSSLHDATVEISLTGPNQSCYYIRFSPILEKPDPSRFFDSFATQPGIFIAHDLETLAAILRRYAELQFSLPDTPLELFKREVSSELTMTTEEMRTERAALVRERIGQNIYREALMRYWERQCAVSCVTVPEALRASHAKPWTDCDSDSERLSVFNGFLLNSILDALFDTGLITFSNGGELIVSPLLPKNQYPDLGLERYPGLRWIDKQHLPFLEWHHKHIFKKEKTQ